MFKSDAVFQRMSRRISANKMLVQSVDAIYQFNVTGESNKSWVVDLKSGAGSVKEGEADSPDCTVSINDKDLADLANDDLFSTAGFISDQIKIQGDPILATKLQGLMS